MPNPSIATAASIAQQAILAISKSQLPPNPTAFTVMYRFFEGANQSLIDALSFRMDDPTSITSELIESLYSQHCGPAESDNEAALSSLLGDGISDVRSIIQDQQQSGIQYSDKLDQAQKILAGANAQQAASAVNQLSQDTRSMQQQITLLQRRVDQARQETSSLQEKLIRSQHAMMTDHLTGLGNRRFYEATLNRAIRDVDESSGRAYLALIDCDEFKSVNDTFGHPFGDEVIKRVGRLMRDSKPDASIARLGGDEFAVFMRCNTIDEVESFAEHLRTTLDSQPIVNRETGDTIRRLTLSIGIAVVRSADDTASWHERADKLLYKAKRLGGNRAVIERFSTA